MMSIMPDGRYELKSFATDDEPQERRVPTACSTRTHTGQGGPLPPTGKHVGDGLRLRDGVRRRQDQAHDEDLACRIGR